MIRAVVFDWGGVLIDDPAPAIVTECSKVLGVSEDSFVAARDLYLPEFDTGSITEKEFWDKVCGELDVPPPTPATLWGDVFQQVYSPRADVFGWASKLYENDYVVGLLSNTEEPNMNVFVAQNYPMFTFTMFSCAEGVRKPEQEIFKRAESNAGVPAASILYLDDKEEYVEAAREAGLESQVARSVDEVKQALTTYSVL